MSFRTTPWCAAALCCLGLAVGGCAPREEVVVEQPAPPVAPATTQSVSVTGTVLAPAGELAYLAHPPWQHRLGQWFMPTANAVTGLVAVPNAVVGLFRLDEEGDLEVEPVITTTTDANGAYTLVVPSDVDLDLTPQLALRAGDGDLVLRRLVTGPVDQVISPVTEAVYTVLADRAADGSIDFVLLQPAELQTIYVQAEQDVNLELRERGLRRALEQVRANWREDAASRKALAAALDRARRQPGVKEAGSAGRGPDMRTPKPDESPADKDRGYGNDPGRHDDDRPNAGRPADRPDSDRGKPGRDDEDRPGDHGRDDQPRPGDARERDNPGRGAADKPGGPPANPGGGNPGNQGGGNPANGGGNRGNSGGGGR